MSHDVPGAHTGNRTYLVVAAVLAVLTAMEVMIFYVEALAPFLLPSLMVLMVAKFALVCGFFMHLRFDSPLLTAIIGWGVVLATMIILGLMAVMGKFAG